MNKKNIGFALGLLCTSSSVYADGSTYQIVDYMISCRFPSGMVALQGKTSLYTYTYTGTSPVTSISESSLGGQVVAVSTAPALLDKGLGIILNYLDSNSISGSYMTFYNSSGSKIWQAFPSAILPDGSRALASFNVTNGATGVSATYSVSTYNSKMVATQLVNETSNDCTWISPPNPPVVPYSDLFAITGLNVTLANSTRQTVADTRFRRIAPSWLTALSRMKSAAGITVAKKLVCQSDVVTVLKPTCVSSTSNPYGYGYSSSTCTIQGVDLGLQYIGGPFNTTLTIKTSMTSAQISYDLDASEQISKANAAIIDTTTNATTGAVTATTTNYSDTRNNILIDRAPAGEAGINIPVGGMFLPTGMVYFNLESLLKRLETNSSVNLTVGATLRPFGGAPYSLLGISDTHMNCSVQ